MRLIDADAIPWDIEGVGEIPVITKEEIEAMPTVDAIPIAWINDWYDTYMYFEVGDLLNDWAERKEDDQTD